MGWLVGGILQRRWLTLAGVVLIVGSAFLPHRSAWALVVGAFGIGLILAQIPLAVRSERRKRQPTPPLPDSR